MKRKSWIILVWILVMLVLPFGCAKPQDPNHVRVSRWALEWEKDVFRAWTREFTEETGITVEWEFTPYTAHFDRLRTDLLSQKAADVIFVNNWGWKPYANIDVFEDLGRVPALSQARSGLMDAAKDAFRSGDKLPGLPVGLVSRVPVVNAADFAAAGVPIPAERTEAFTASELTTLLGRVADASGRSMGINMTLTDALYLLTASAGAPVVTEDNRIGCDTPDGIRAVEEFRQFAASGRAVPLSQSTGGSYGTPDTAIMTGQVVSSYTNPGGFKSLTESGYDIASIPTLKAEGGRDVVLADFNTLVVPKFSGSKNAAYRLIDWMLQKEAQLQYTAFADLPTNAAAFGEVMTDGETWPPELYRAFGVGIDDLYVPPALSIDFQTLLGGTLKNLVDGAITAEQFCHKLAADGPNYL